MLIERQRTSSDLVEAGDIHRLDVVLEGLDLLLKVVGRHFLVFNNAPNDQLVHSVSDGFLLVLGFPDKAVLLNLQNLLSHGVQVSLLFPGFALKDNQGLGDGTLLLVGFLGLLLLLLKLLLGFLCNKSALVHFLLNINLQDLLRRHLRKGPYHLPLPSWAHQQACPWQRQLLFGVAVFHQRRRSRIRGQHR